MGSPKVALILSLIVSTMLATVGCDDGVDESTTSQKPPKPVSTMILRRSSPSVPRYTAATIVPWKAERIGFEIAGRVVEVVEPYEMVVAHSKSNIGTTVARLDDQPMRIAVESAKADIEVAIRRMETNRVAIEQRLPASVESASAEFRLAQQELERSRKLGTAISASELDSIRTRASTARLLVTRSEAALTQAEADQLTLEAQVQQARQRLAEAERILRNAVLYSAFTGQIAETHAVPGSYVGAGDPVATVIMMDPMMVEVEVSADDSRRYHHGDVLALSVSDREGRQQALSGSVYSVDSVADEATRTFTVRLHVRNRKVTSAAEDGCTFAAKTVTVSSVNVGPVVTGDSRILAESTSIHEVEGRLYVWKVLNRNSDQRTTSNDRVLDVERVEVKVVGERVQFLGRWDYVPIAFVDPGKFDVQRNLITGQLHFEEEFADENSVDQWKGGRVLLEDSQWLLRAGDVATVELNSEHLERGFYVPMKAVRKEKGGTFVHVIEGSEPDVTARRVRVKVPRSGAVADEALLLKVESGTESLQDGMQVVVGGTHFLNDGDRVRIVTGVEGSRP